MNVYTYRCWHDPPRNNHHQNYYMFGRGSLSIFTFHCWRGITLMHIYTGKKKYMYICIYIWYALNMHILYILRMFITTLQRQCIAFSFTLRSSGKSQRAFLEGIMWTTYRSRVILQNMIHLFKSPSVWKKLVGNTIIEAFFQNRLRSI